MGFLAAIPVALAFLLWIALVANSLSLRSSDAAGNGLSEAFGVFMALGLWVLLAIVLLIASGRVAMPGWTKVAALLLVPASCAAAIASISLMRHGSGFDGRWPVVVPALVPGLILGYALWVFFPSWQKALPAGQAGGIAWGLVLALSLVPWPSLATQSTKRSRTAAEYAVRQAAEANAKRSENRARFDTLTADSPLEQWLKFLTDGNELRNEAIARIGTLARRQTDAEALIAKGVDLPMMELQNLNLELTPAFRDIALGFLLRDAASFQREPGMAEYPSMAFRLERHLYTLQWLVSHGCDVQPAVAAYEVAVKSYPECPESNLFLSKLAKLRTPASQNTP